MENPFRKNWEVILKCKDYSKIYLYLSDVLIYIQVIILLLFIILFIETEKSKIPLFGLIIIAILFFIKDGKEFLSTLKKNDVPRLEVLKEGIFQESTGVFIPFENIKVIRNFFTPDSTKYGVYFKIRYYLFLKDKIRGYILKAIILSLGIIILFSLYIRREITIVELLIVLGVLLWFSAGQGILSRLIFSVIMKIKVKDSLKFKYVLISDYKKHIFIFVSEDCFKNIKELLGGDKK